jgi:hypothetical protein
MAIPGVSVGVPAPGRQPLQHRSSLWAESSLFIGPPLLLHPDPEPYAILNPVLADDGVAFAAGEDRQQAVDLSPAVIPRITKGPRPAGQILQAGGTLAVGPALLVGEATLCHPLTEGKPTFDMALRNPSMALSDDISLEQRKGIVRHTLEIIA